MKNPEGVAEAEFLGCQESVATKTKNGREWSGGGRVGTRQQIITSECEFVKLTGPKNRASDWWGGGRGRRKSRSLNATDM